jgi:hypothetical protein
VQEKRSLRLDTALARVEQRQGELQDNQEVMANRLETITEYLRKILARRAGSGGTAQSGFASSELVRPLSRTQIAEQIVRPRRPDSWEGMGTLNCCSGHLLLTLSSELAGCLVCTQATMFSPCCSDQAFRG